MAAVERGWSRLAEVLGTLVVVVGSQPVAVGSRAVGLGSRVLTSVLCREVAGPPCCLLVDIWR